MRIIVFVLLSIGFLAATGEIGSAQSDNGAGQEIVTRNLVASNNKTVTLDGDGKPKIIAGNNNKIQIKGDCSSLKILGNANSVEVERVGNIQIVGDSNRVSYVHGLGGDNPIVADIGKDNQITRVPALGSVSPSPTAQSAVETAEDVQVITLANDTSTAAVQKPRVRLVGSNNSVVLTGVAQLLEIEGSNNDVEIDRVDKVIFHGSNNDVLYKQDPSSGEVVSEARGSNNEVEKEE